MKSAKIMNGLYWAYFAPDGYVQVRTIADTKKVARGQISKWEPFTWKDYEAKGYILKRVNVSIVPVDWLEGRHEKKD